MVLYCNITNSRQYCIRPPIGCLTKALDDDGGRERQRGQRCLADVLEKRTAKVAPG
ncbi:hypothetical protein GCM10010994_36330 [Chelatococcus reniformis]|uniref:Uncharacterized protein n=1 Tax=Chelatococcus reniformis TaxID=1494448 RepID=A0A916UJ71_9HYPH|nr:hypothetical protein GCM10010994_36330 [Chelatococcus reniformis]